MKSKFRNIFYSLVALVVLGAGLSVLQSKMNSIRYEEKLTDAEPLENAPPVLAFTTIALGGFRGLLADYLWLRSSQMQDDGKYFEMVQLANWIVKLQPRYTPSTAFLAWNMAYNVSVTFTRFEDRWRWVKRGIELIRDEALERNPGDPELYQQLGWIFQHKMGQDLDDANKFYKDEFAKEMIRLFGPHYGKWEELLKAPDNEVKLRAALGDAGFKKYQKLLAKYSIESFEVLEENFRTYATIFPKELREDMREEGIYDIVELCLRTRWITKKYRLDPAWILKINKQHGEFDWRLPEAHAVYWAERGRSNWAVSRANGKSFKILQCNRMIFQSLQNAFIAGKLVYIANKDDDLMYENIQHLEIKPNLELAEAANAAYVSAMNEFGQQPVAGAYMNFLVRAIAQLYINGKVSLAKKFQEYGQNVKDENGLPKYGTRFAGTVRDFARKTLMETLVSPSNKDANAIVRALLFQAMMEYSLGNEEQDKVGDNYLLEAKKAYFNYKTFVQGTELRRSMAPWNQVAQMTLLETILMLEKPEKMPENPDQLTPILNNLKNPQAAILFKRFQDDIKGKQLLMPTAEELKESEIK